jgi:glycosyltransferase AglE
MRGGNAGIPGAIRLMTEQNLPLISVIIETFTVSHEYPADEAGPQLASVLDRLGEQAYPRDRTEIIVILDEESADLTQFIRSKYPAIKTSFVEKGTYLSMKSRGFDVAQGEMLALLDADCIPVTNWLDRIASAYAQDIDVVAGKTRYRRGKPFADTFSVFDFGHVHADRSGRTFAFNLNNVAFRRQVVALNRFDSRAKRNGGCFLFWRKLQMSNHYMIYDPQMFAGHGPDFRGLGFVRKHVERGFDSVNLFRVVDPELLPPARYRRFGLLVPLGMFVSRMLFDIRRVVSNRRDLGIRLYAVPYYYAAALVLRGLEAVGGIIAILKPHYFSVD